MNHPVGSFCCTPRTARGPLEQLSRSVGAPTDAPLPATANALPGGPFRMGTDDAEGYPSDGEGPVREVTVGPFAIDTLTVSNARYAQFVEATGYVTETEWEYAARGGLEQARFPWGDELTPGGQHRCNGWKGTAPVDAYAPNGFGLHNVAGNVWEWCADWFSATHHLTRTSPADRTNPTGPATGDSRVMRGGSYLCHASCCNRYRVAARTANTPDSAGGNNGFRVVWDLPTGAGR